MSGPLLGSAGKDVAQAALAGLLEDFVDQFGGDAFTLKAGEGVERGDLARAFLAIGLGQQRDNPREMFIGDAIAVA